MAVRLESIRNCFDGAVPSVVATCDQDGMPNAAYNSQVHFVDERHVALSFQFFNKTRENVLANGLATVQVVDPDSGQHYHLSLRYLRTETEGPLFENMKAKLAGIASHTGMTKVFRLRGADVYEVLDVIKVAGAMQSASPMGRNRLAALRACTERLAQCADLGQLFDATLQGMAAHFDVHHSMLLMLDESGERLYTVGSYGYPESGVGSEILLGEGVIGVVARERTPIRITHMAREYLYSRAVRESFLRAHGAQGLETGIPLPGLQESHSQLAVPIFLHTELLGVLYVESPQEQRFTYEDEDALVTLAHYLALAIRRHSAADDEQISLLAASAGRAASGKPALIRHYTADDSIFVDEEYLIKGVAGAILWKLLRENRDQQRSDFTNRELRLDPALRLPDVVENLEARLILLQRRLGERCGVIAIEKTGRGRFRLRIDRPLQLIET